MDVSISRAVAALVNPALRGGGLYHRVLPGDVISGHGQVGHFAHVPHDVQVRQGRFDHDHVRALGDVLGDFFQRLAAVGRVHLVGLAVAELRGAVGGFAERAVHGGRILGGIGQEGRVGKALRRRARARRAATRPSIMSEGATTSAPASA